MKNALTIDLEDWFCANNITEYIGKDNWDKCESRIKGNTEIILNTLNKKNIKATFFVLGWIAERFPDLIKTISNENHEIASHSYSHSIMYHSNSYNFEKRLLKSIQILENITNKKIIGFRAPSFSITPKTLWALDILIKNGIKYDSSVFPVGFHPDYGLPNTPLHPYEIKKGLIEFPLTCYNIFGKTIPVSGGAYFRLLPYNLTKFFLKKIEKERPFVFYLHPWEIDYNQPRINLKLTKRIRHYFNLNKTLDRFNKLIQDFEFTTMIEVLKIESDA